MSDEITILEMLLARARQTGGANHQEIAVGDIVQLRPGADPHWQTSLLLVCRILDDGGIQGQILRPHRGGYREAWYTYRPPEVIRVGRMPYPEPDLQIRAWSYDGPQCEACGLPEVRKPAQREKWKDRPRRAKQA
jgi:hypothetical protein